MTEPADLDPYAQSFRPSDTVDELDLGILTLEDAEVDNEEHAEATTHSVEFQKLMDKYHLLCHPTNATATRSHITRNKTTPVFSSSALRILLDQGVSLSQFALLGHLEENAPQSDEQ